jgi:hypothetical protein
LNISRMRAAGVAADVVAAWHGHTERMTQAVYGRVTDDVSLPRQRCSSHEH